MLNKAAAGGGVRCGKVAHGDIVAEGIEDRIVEHEEHEERDTGGHAKEQAALHDVAEHYEVFGAKCLCAKSVERQENYQIGWRKLNVL